MTQLELANKLKVHQSDLCGFLSGHPRRNFSDKKKEKIAQILGTTFMDMLNLGRSLEKIENPPPEGPTHPEIITLFQDKEQARQLNHMLVLLEKNDPDKYKLAITYVTALHDAIKAEKKKEKEQAQAKKKDKAEGHPPPARRPKTS